MLSYSPKGLGTAVRNLILVGPMGAGKSTVGRGLADYLQWPFVDMDQEIERRTGVDIPTIFEFEGEEGFRRRETELLRSLLQHEGQIIATGGGVVMRPENRELMRGECVLYLRTPVAEQYRRTRRSRNRPLLSEAHDRREKLESLFRIRDPLYQEVATITLEGRRQKVDEAVKMAFDVLMRPDSTPAG